MVDNYTKPDVQTAEQPADGKLPQTEICGVTERRKI